MNSYSMQLPENAANFVPVNVNGNTMLPLYRHGDMLLVAENAPVKFGDRVVVESKSSGWLGGTLIHHSKDLTVLIRGGNHNKEVAITSQDLQFFGRIVWASQ